MYADVGLLFEDKALYWGRWKFPYPTYDNVKLLQVREREVDFVINVVSKS